MCLTQGRFLDEQQKPRVFLSYARVDRPRVTKIAEALSAAGLSVWWDTAIEGGSAFAKDIARELDAADVVVVVWSVTSVESAWVLDEAGAGRDRKRLVPVQIDATLPPLGFRQLQSIDLSAWKGRAGDAKFAALVSAIQKLAGSAAVVPVVKAAPASSGPNRRVLIGGATGIATLAAGGFGAWKFMGSKARDDGTASVVVLPFANLSGDPAQAFFSDGIAEELRNALSQLPGLKVIGRVSSERFRDADDLSVAAEKLGVDHVLTGSVRRSPNTIRIGAQLVDGRTGVESWSHSYDQPVGDLLAVQSKIANSVVAALSAKLSKAVGTIVVGGTDIPAAQELFLKAGELFKRAPSEANTRQQLAFIDAALALDPNYAEAWARKANLTRNLNNYTESAAARADLRAASMAASQRAVGLAPRSGFVRMSLANQYRSSLDMRRALAEGQHAVALAPGDGRVLRDYATIIVAIDPDRSVALARDAVATDPLNPFYGLAYSATLLYARQYRKAVEAAQNVRTATGDLSGVDTLVWALLQLGETDKARDNLRFVTPDRTRFALSAIVEARAGNRVASDTSLAAFRKSDFATNYWRAAAHAQRGETTAALDAIEEAFRNREPGITGIAFNSMFDPLRREPRFKAVQDAVIPPNLLVPPKRSPA